MAKTKNIGWSFSALRGPSHIERRRPALPGEPLAEPGAPGFIDLSDSAATVSRKTLDAVAPLGAIFDHRRPAEEKYWQLLGNFLDNIPNDLRFLPAKFRCSPEAKVLAANYRVVDRLDDQGKTFYQRPLELLVVESYRERFQSPTNYPSGAGHWVYDPISARWFLVQRWGSGGLKVEQQKDEITCYRHWASASKLRTQLEYKLKLQSRLPVDSLANVVSDQLLACKFVQPRGNYG